VRPVDRATRAAAAGEGVGPVAFVAAWVATGATASHYSPVNDAISRLAALHAPTRTAMTAGFVVFGIGVPCYAYALHRAMNGWAWLTAAATGLATLGVAAMPLDRSTAGDRLHGVFAGVGYVTLAATPLLASPQLRRAGRIVAARVSIVAGAVAGTSLALTLGASAHGLFQRTGLTAGDAWLVASAVAIIRARD
jgi:hypothetical membrane protein